MTKLKSISTLHVILLCMTFIGFKTHVSIITSILSASGRDGWMAVLLAGILFLPWLLLIVVIHKKTKQQPINEWIKQKFGRIFGNMIIYFTAFFLIILAAFTMHETLLWINTTFLPRTPTLALFIIFFITIILLILTSIETIAIVNVLVLFGVLVFCFFIAIVNVPIKDYSLLRPFLEHGISPVIAGTIYPAAAYAELLLFVFLQHRIKDQLKFRHYAIMLFLLVGLTLGPLLGSITEFGPTEAAKQRYPAFEQWGIATIGRFIEHLDFLSFYQWLTGAFIRIGILLYLVTQLFNLTGNKNGIWRYVAAPFFFITLILGLIEDSTFLTFKAHEFLIITFIYLFVLSLILFIAAILPEKEVKHTSDTK